MTDPTDPEAPFAFQAEFYDTIYASKPYREETEKVISIINQHRGSFHSMLSIGSGSCRYEIEFARRGVKVVAVDRCEAMIAQGERRIRDENLADKITIVQGSGSKIKLPCKFDCAAALFCVVNYCTSTNELEQLISNCLNHVKPGGLLIFDSWYAPGVEASPPTPCEKIFEVGSLTLERRVQPRKLKDKYSFSLRYRFATRQRNGCASDVRHENHQVRAFDPEEVFACAAASSASVVSALAWPSLTPLDATSWVALWVLKRV